MYLWQAYINFISGYLRCQSIELLFPGLTVNDGKVADEHMVSHTVNGPESINQPTSLHSNNKLVSTAFALMTPFIYRLRVSAG